MFFEFLESYPISSKFCTQFAVRYFCNHVFAPCNLTTGEPISSCSYSCYVLRDRCSIEYFQIAHTVVAGGIFPYVDYCENPLIYLQQSFGSPQQFTNQLH